MRDVYFIQVKYPSDERELENLLTRWDSYGYEVKKAHGKNEITVVSPIHRLNLGTKYTNLSGLSEKSSFILNLFLMYRKIRASGRIVTLVSGDNQLSLLFSLILKTFLPSRISVQSQFHGDTYSREINPGIKGFFRITTSRMAIKFSDSIRVVSKFQEPEIQMISGGVDVRLVIAPIPIDYSKIPNKDEFSSIYDIAFIGRLHSERGIVQAVSILKQLISNRPSIKIVIVGEGPERRFIESNLKDEIAQGFIDLTGTLHGYELRKIYAGSKVLLSSAPREGHGLTLREALLSGMSVIARDSLGARETSKDFPTSLQLFTSTTEAVEQILSEIDIEKKLKDTSGHFAVQARTEEESLKRLVESWIND